MVWFRFAKAWLVCVFSVVQVPASASFEPWSIQLFGSRSGESLPAVTE